MPVITKVKHQELLNALNSRYSVLRDALEARELKSYEEGLNRGSWQYPEKMCATRGSTVDVALALADFKAILTELGKVK